jgi:hypothetical protein
MEQVKSQTQTQDDKEKLVDILTKRILEEKQELITKKIKEVLEYWISRNHDEETEEIVPTGNIVGYIKGALWDVSEMYAVLEKGERAWFDYFNDTYGYSGNEMIISIGGELGGNMRINIEAPSGPDVGTLEVSLAKSSMKENYERAKEIYREWKNIIDTIYGLAKEMAEEVKEQMRYNSV